MSSRKSSRKRWVCPLCEHGHLAPSKPRKNNALRYCLPCTKKTGKLVERECPALDSQRKQKAEAKKETAKRKRERRPPKPRKTKRSWMNDPKWQTTCRRSKETTNIMEVIEKICKSKAWDEGVRKALVSRGKDPNTYRCRGNHYAEYLWMGTMDFRGSLKGSAFKIRRGRASPWYVTGRAFGSHSISMTVGTKACHGDLLMTIVHEVAHCVQDGCIGNPIIAGKCRPHDLGFNIIMLHVAKELWGYPRNAKGSGFMAGNGYAPSRILQQWLAQQIKEGNPKVTQFLNYPTTRGNQ
jgi:hypothetical protein